MIVYEPVNINIMEIQLDMNVVLFCVLSPMLMFAFVLFIVIFRSLFKYFSTFVTTSEITCSSFSKSRTAEEEKDTLDKRRKTSVSFNRERHEGKFLMFMSV